MTEMEEMLENREKGVIKGVLDIARVSSGKRLQTTSIKGEKGVEYVLSYRPMPEYYAFVERKVVAEGEHYEPQGQAIYARHFSASSVKLADGEQPIQPVPKYLPAPDYVEDDMSSFVGRWIRARVSMVDSFLPEGESWVELNLLCEDSKDLIRTSYPQSRTSKYDGLKGKKFSIIGLLRSRAKVDGEPIAQPEYAMQAYVLEQPGFECSSNVPLQGSGPLPKSRNSGKGDRIIKL